MKTNPSSAVNYTKTNRRTSIFKTLCIVIMTLPCATQAQTNVGALSQFTVNSFSGTGNVSVQAVVTDAGGNIYIAGTTSAADMVVVNAAQPAMNSGTSDAFVAKLAPGGTQVLWSTFLGGSSKDTATAIGLDALGNVYVTGNTSSADFPATVPGIGTQGSGGAFLTQYNTNGNRLYSVVIGSATVSGMAVSPQGDVFLAGIAGSSFAVSPMGLPTQPDARGVAGFAVRLNVAGGLIYAGGVPGLILSEASSVAVAAEAGGSALFGSGANLLRLTADGSILNQVAQLTGVIYSLDVDTDGNVYVAIYDVQTAAPETGDCGSSLTAPGAGVPGDIIVVKLQAGQLTPIYTTRLSGQCASVPQVIRAGPGGTVTLSLLSSGGFPLLNPIFEYSTFAGYWLGAVARLGPDGTLLYATYLPTAAAAAAAAPDGSLLYAIGQNPLGGGVSGAVVFQLPVAPLGGLTITGAFNGFDSKSAFPSPGMLLTIPGQNLTNDWIDLGLNDANPLPTQLGGVQVLFDGNPGEIMQVAPDHVICVIPWQLAQPDRVTVQVVSGSAASSPLVLSITPGNGKFGLLTRAFPALPVGSVDGNIRNADGTLNDADYPAAPGSIVTLFGTGSFVPGPVYLPWNAPVYPKEGTGYTSLPGTARVMGPGFIEAIYAIDVQIPPSLNPGVLTRNVIGTVGLGIGVYVR